MGKGDAALKRLSIALSILLLAALLCACGSAKIKEGTEPEPLDPSRLSDGTYSSEVQLRGGSGKAGVVSPVTVRVESGKAVAVLVWTSKNYDYMLVDGTRYDVLSIENGSTFEIPVSSFNAWLPVIGDTTAMSVPHEVEYELYFSAPEKA